MTNYFICHLYKLSNELKEKWGQAGKQTQVSHMWGEGLTTRLLAQPCLSPSITLDNVAKDRFPRSVRHETRWLSCLNGICSILNLGKFVKIELGSIGYLRAQKGFGDKLSPCLQHGFLRSTENLVIYKMLIP